MRKRKALVCMYCSRFVVRAVPVRGVAGWRSLGVLPRSRGASDVSSDVKPRSGGDMETSGSPRSYPILSSGERDRASNLFASAQRCSRGEVKGSAWLHGVRWIFDLLSEFEDLARSFFSSAVASIHLPTSPSSGQRAPRRHRPLEENCPAPHGNGAAAAPYALRP